jgi:hypothetical protein
MLAPIEIMGSYGLPTSAYGLALTRRDCERHDEVEHERDARHNRHDLDRPKGVPPGNCGRLDNGWFFLCYGRPSPIRRDNVRTKHLGVTRGDVFAKRGADYLTSKGFCVGCGCAPIVIEELDTLPESLFFPGNGKA